ncbi:MAG: hypothetical protein V4649_05475 [Bacteroidota bacterium]
MNFRLFLILILSAFFSSTGVAIAQSKAATRAADSARDARAHIADSMRAARAHATDSMKLARQSKTDSIQAVRKHKADSAAALVKYKNSKKYKDSVAKARTAKTEAAKSGRDARMDSLAAARLHSTDSIALTRRTRTDSIKTMQKRRTDSLASVKKYKASKRYTDSVTIVKNNRTDSVKAVQKEYRDSVATVRKKSMDSAKTVRKHSTDSMKTVRTKYMDSVKIVRKTRTDSMAKKKAEKEKLVKAKEKKKEDLTKLKLELKIKQKREQWSNKNMLKKKWTPVRSLTQNAFTHFNYYYNANKKMEEAELNMRRAPRESYDSLISLFPFDPNRDSSLLAADMDSIIHKVSVGIQIHDPRVKWSSDMYLILGQAYYYKGSYERASVAFRYIIATDQEEKKKDAAKHGYKSSGSSIVEDDKKSVLSFMQHKSVHNEAILWLSRTYTTMNQVENAESILSLLESDAKLPKELKGRLAIEKAFAYLAEDNRPAASTQLTIAADDNTLPDWLRQRAAYLNGQLLQEMKSHTEAAQSFDAVLDYYPKIEMDFYARKNAAFNRLMAGESSHDAMVSLKKILNDGKYSNYYDQIYYVLGQLAVKANMPTDAITYFSKSAATPKASKRQKAQSFVALGDAYYSQAMYPYAKKSYDSAAKYSIASSKDAAVLAALQKSKVLADISAPLKTIHDQDSLLALAAMSRKEQLSVVRGHLRQLEKARQDSVLNAEAGGTAKEPEVELAGPDVSSWYFSNPVQVQQGSFEFKRKWGTRKLADNWRRASAISFVNTSAATEEDGDEAEATGKDNALTEESLMAKIPNTQAQKDAALKSVHKAYIALAKAYVKQLEDYARATSTLDTLNRRSPAHTQKEEELYLRYQIAVKQNNLDKAQAYGKELLDKFPSSPYASLLRPASEAGPSGEGTKVVADYYDDTYKLLMQHQYTEVLMRASYAKKQYNHPTYNKRFEIVEASANAAMGNYDKADTIITSFMRSYPGDTLTAWAGNVKEYVKQVRANGGKPLWYKEGPAGTTSSSTAKTDAAADAPPAPPKPVVPTRPTEVPYGYAYQADSPHYAIIVLPGLDSRTADLKKGIRAFDSSKYKAANLDIFIDFYDATEGVIVVKPFGNAALAKSYLADLNASTALKSFGAGEVKVLTISAPNYRKMFYEKNIQPYFGFYESNYK